MSDHVANLIDFWHRGKITGPPFAHYDDWKALRSYEGRYIDEEPKDFGAFLSSSRFGNFTDKRFHLSLLPIPYGGNLRTANIIILLLNPGFSLTDYYAETRVPQFRRHLKQMLAQDFDGINFPFIWLDPEYCWHGGFRWWEEKLRDVITIIAKKKKISYFDAMHDISKRLAHVELVPYHSRQFDARLLVDQLCSVHAARRFAHEAWIQAANEKNKTIIVPRSVKAWKLPEVRHNNLVMYEAGQARGASLGPKSAGGRAILRQYDISCD